EPVQTTCQMEEPLHLVFETGVDDQPIVQTSQHPEWFSQPKRPPSSDHDWNKTLPTAQGDAQSWISDLARQTDARSSFNELLDTPIDFSNFIMNRLNPLPLIPDNQDRRVIPFDHFINNDLEYLGEFLTGGGNISSSIGSQLTGNLLSMYTPRGGSSLSPSSRLWNGTTISIWIGFWSIVIKRRVKDLQLGVESYQKRLNLTKPDTYRPDLKRSEAYTAYSNPRGFIYQNKDKKNKLMRIDELHKFSDGTLNDVRNALDDRLKGIQMQYLPTTIWRRGDKDIAAAMIQAIDKMLKTRRSIRSLEKFVGGRLKVYKEYYACATGEAAPKPKVSARKKKGNSASSITPPTLTPTTTVVSAPRLSATAKDKRRTSLNNVVQVQMKELVSESEGESDEEETRQKEEESFDQIPRTPEGSEDESNDEED
nr:hypothetical protein [Tanacetum cinerariifolium]